MKITLENMTVQNFQSMNGDLQPVDSITLKTEAGVLDDPSVSDILPGYRNGLQI